MIKFSQYFPVKIFINQNKVILFSYIELSVGKPNKSRDHKWCSHLKKVNKKKNSGKKSVIIFY